jgi:Flp pilus assembly protein TadG
MREDRGQALVEFALVVPLLIVIVAGIFQVGPAWNKKLSLNSAVREAARVASTCRFAASPQASTDAINAAFDAVADDALPGHDQIAPAGVQYAGGACATGVRATVTGTYPLTLSLLGINVLDITLSSTSATTVE